MPKTRELMARLIQRKAYVLRASNTSLGLEVDEGVVGDPNPLTDTDSDTNGDGVADLVI